jgi:adenylate cyclase
LVKEKVYRYSKRFPRTRAEVWRALADTEHLNRVSGLFPVDFSPAQFLDQSIFRYAEAKVFGFVPVKWREYPFEWVKEERYSIERVYEGGPIKRMFWTLELNEVPGDFPVTEVTGTARFTTANPLGHIAIPIAAVPPIKRLIIDYLDKYEDANKNSSYLKLPQEKKTYTADRVRMSRLLDKLMSVHPFKEQIALFHEHITSSGDDEVLQIKPYVLADRWGQKRHLILTMFLHATKLGLLTQSWNLMCPNCRVPKAAVHSLSDVTSQVHCDLCGVDYDLNFDQYVEMRFSVHPSIRKAEDQTYCIAGPMKSPHIFAQYRIKPHSAERVYYPALPESARIRMLKVNHMIQVENGQWDELTYTQKGWINKTAFLSPEGGTILILNNSDEEQILVFEKTQWDDQTVTAADVTSLQLFRDLFSKEVLAPDQQIGVESLTILFSDLRGSTSLYEKIGDAKAYHHVYRHFDFLRQKIASHNGAIVKTIGDSIMASFYKPEDALKAALHIQAESSRFNQTNGTDMVIKIGLFTGPAIAVNANDVLDYFGHTVNMAARIQQQSHGGDIMISEAEWERESFAQAAGKFSFSTANVKAKLSGIREEVPLVQLKDIALREKGNL